jgi:hypothetical protein
MSGLPKDGTVELVGLLFSVLHQDFHVCNSPEEYLVRKSKRIALAKNPEQKGGLVVASNPGKCANYFSNQVFL